jgi:hypothetical protein
MSVGEMTLEAAAKEAAGSWQKWTCFVWFRANEIHDPDNWAIVSRTTGTRVCSTGATPG